MAVWSLLLALMVFLVSLGTGALMHLDGYSQAVLLHGALRILLVTVMTVLVVLPYALAASAGRALPAAAGPGDPGAGCYPTPWWWPAGAIISPGRCPGCTPRISRCPPVSYVIVALTGLLGMAATYAWWMNADQSK